jgi:hypothetical protein
MTTDTTSVVRLYVASVLIGLLVLLWIVVARDPFPSSRNAAANSATSTKRDSRVAALDRRERLLQVRTREVSARHEARWAAWRAELRGREDLSAAAAEIPAVALPQVSYSDSDAYDESSDATTRSS